MSPRRWNSWPRAAERRVLLRVQWRLGNLDVEADRAHPVKRLRPVAMGELSGADPASVFAEIRGRKDRF